MCGRYSLTRPLEVLQLRFGFMDVNLEGDLEPRYNIAPTQDVPVVVTDGGARVLRPMRWGLVPVWAKDVKIGNRMINARAETVAEKNSFKRPLQKQRCIVPADGFYEWQKVPGQTKKQPMRITRNDGEPFGLAGLWDRWKDPEGGELFTFTIITTDANDLVRPIHDRMPVILTREAEETWLDTDVQDPEQLQALLTPHDESVLQAYPVSTVVNSPGRDTPDCIAPLGER